MLQGGVLVDEDYTVIQESLERCLQSYQEYQAEWKLQLKGQQDEFISQLQRSKQKHALEIRNERDKQKQLQGSLQSAKKAVQDARAERDEWTKRVEELQNQHRQLEVEMDRRHGIYLNTGRELDAREKDLERLRKLCQEKDYDRQRLEDRLHQLQVDLQNVYRLQQSQVNTALAQAQRDLHRVWQSQQALQGKLSGQTQGLEMLLKQRGIAVPNVIEERKSDPPPPPPSRRGDSTTEKEVVEKTRIAAMAALEGKEDNDDNNDDNDSNNEDYPEDEEQEEAQPMVD